MMAIKYYKYFLVGILSLASPRLVLGQPEFWPQFKIVGAEQEAELLNRFHWAHHQNALSNCTLWDRWLPHSTLWSSETKRNQIRESLLNRRIDAEGYVSMQQHRGMAHAEGWPFPAWQQSTGKGFHFSIDQEAWAVQHFQLQPLKTWEDWGMEGAKVLGIDPQRGLQLQIDEDLFQLTTPFVGCGTIVAPFVRFEFGFSTKSRPVECYVEWLFEGETQWPKTRRWEFSFDSVDSNLQYLHLPLYRHPEYGGVVTRFRLTIRHARETQLDLKSVITAIDTRHPITNLNYLRACADYFCWTGDVAFLQQNIARMRRALNFALSEFNVRQQRHIMVPWVGHNGRSGITFDSEGNKVLRPGWGVGNNYWDLLPFGGHDGLATIYLYDALLRIAELESAIAGHPDWRIDSACDLLSSKALRKLAEEVSVDFQQRFWNIETGRFVGWRDTEGNAYDYGFTFVNLEAIAYGLASQDQEKSIISWLSGERIIDGDTSQGADIYHWKFGPRATTRRNIETYVWAWSAPEAIDWGGQVQDGGAVLGFAYYDLLARLNVEGPDKAWERLREILQWYAETELAGGYRAYYSIPGRGTLQGGGTAGGLGIDYEFLESVLVPQIMLYGFLGFRPTPTGYELKPQLPSDWKSLTITNIHFRQAKLSITAHSDGRVEVKKVEKVPGTF